MVLSGPFVPHFLSGVRPGCIYRGEVRASLGAESILGNPPEVGRGIRLIYSLNPEGMAARRSLRVGARLRDGSSRGSSLCSTRGEVSMELPQTMQIETGATRWRLGRRRQATRSIDGVADRQFAPGAATTTRKWQRWWSTGAGGSAVSAATADAARVTPSDAPHHRSSRRPCRCGADASRPS